jgi:uncharacterized protein (TIGR03083 family)
MIARLYRDNQKSFVALLESLEPDDWAVAVPCTPDWTVRDVLSHVAGVTDDLASGRLEGAGTPPWTASQIVRNRDLAVSDMITRWNAQIDAVAEVLERLGEMRPVFDCITHEHDIRHALGRSIDRESEMVGVMSAGFASGTLPVPVTIVFDDDAPAAVSGVDEADPIELSGVSRFEFVRSRLGRRTADQVRGYRWSQPPSDELIAGWFVFGPSPAPIVD